MQEGEIVAEKRQLEHRLQALDVHHGEYQQTGAIVLEPRLRQVHRERCTSLWRTGGIYDSAMSTLPPPTALLGNSVGSQRGDRRRCQAPAAKVAVCLQVLAERPPTSVLGCGVCSRYPRNQSRPKKQC